MPAEKHNHTSPDDVESPFCCLRYPPSLLHETFDLLLLFDDSAAMPIRALRILLLISPFDNNKERDLNTFLMNLMYMVLCMFECSGLAKKKSFI